METNRRGFFTGLVAGFVALKWWKPKTAALQTNPLATFDYYVSMLNLTPDPRGTIFISNIQVPDIDASSGLSELQYDSPHDDPIGDLLLSLPVART